MRNQRDPDPTKIRIDNIDDWIRSLEGRRLVHGRWGNTEDQAECDWKIGELKRLKSYGSPTTEEDRALLLKEEIRWLSEENEELKDEIQELKRPALEDSE